MAAYNDSDESTLPEFTLRTLPADLALPAGGAEARRLADVALGAMRLNLYRAELSAPFVGEEVPRALWSCNVLRELHIESCGLKRLPAALFDHGSFDYLLKIAIVNCELETLPAMDLINLVSLVIVDNNGMDELPEEFPRDSKLPSLLRFSARRCGLRRIPAAWDEFRDAIVQFDIRGNPYLEESD